MTHIEIAEQLRMEKGVSFCIGDKIILYGFRICDGIVDKIEKHDTYTTYLLV